jgi:DNA-binding response OmpR family regulator/nitrogen-specific signal transduction histidine kinase
LPPWWKTWWAYGGYAFIVVLLLFGARKMIVRDERLKAKLQLEHLNLEKAQEVDRVKTSFFTNISHEFRTPLTLIKGPVQELMEKYANDSSTRGKLKLIQRNSDLLLRLINQLLDLARVEAGTLKLEKAEDDVYSFLRAIASSFESYGRQKGVSLSVEIPVVPYVIVYDKDKVETIVINLINNAIKFTPSGGSVHMKAIVDNSTLRLSVRDTGIGISKEHQVKIFERFHQLSEAHKEVGTGIGLSLVKELVAFVGGTIEVISDTGKGSEFIVAIPVESVGVDANKSLEAKQPITTESVYANSQEYDNSYVASNGKNGKQLPPEGSPQILVVEDNLDVRSFIIDCLGTEFAFIEAENGLVGLDKARTHTPDLIISDVMMPEMDGMQMTQEIKADIRTSHIPLIMLTAKSTEDSKLHGLQTGADDYLIKPFNKNELVLKVRNAISRQQKLREKLTAELMSSSPRVEVMSQDERFLKTVKDKILERLNDEQLSVEALSEDVGLSRSQLLRKVTSLTGMSVNELIRKLRLHRAAQLIAQDWGPVSQIAYEVGFSNLSYFSKVFKEEFGVSPSEYTSNEINS